MKGDRFAFLIVALLAVVWWVVYNNLQPVADWLTFGLLRLDPASNLGESVAFFLYDVPKLLLLLSGMIFVITLLQTFVPPEKVREAT